MVLKNGVLDIHMIKKFSSPKMRNRQFVFTPKIEYELVAGRGEPKLFDFSCLVPSAGIEPALPAPEAGALSVKLRGQTLTQNCFGKQLY